MDRREAILRELNMYPLWVRRTPPAPVNLAAIETIAPKPPESLLASVDIHAESANTQRANQAATSPALTLPQSGMDMRLGGLRVPNVREEPGDLGWPELKRLVRDCTACRLRAGCTQTVFGVGDSQADWLFVGEAPGADEDVQGDPFVGQAGKLLDNMLTSIKLKRGKNVAIANVVKCRPPGNRNPAADEITQCLPYLQRQIALIQPKLIVALGKVAAHALLGKDATIAALRGKLHDYWAPATGLEGVQGDESSRLPHLMELSAIRLDEQTTLAKSLVVPHQTITSHRVGAATPLIVTFHPAYLLRSPSEKAKAWQDLCFAVETIKRYG